MTGLLLSLLYQPDLIMMPCHLHHPETRALSTLLSSPNQAISCGHPAGFLLPSEGNSNHALLVSVLLSLTLSLSNLSLLVSHSP